ncbi:hypothetical protein AAFF_G00274740 [Aldrovandia affinis]|uniref:Uncharacterized protein n=1 Tax=Aldrovandia affinis TaxID=143900 RepID=A0AAD7ST09_9TELE|nr:hypothetical protein AAFF_G00274740 [Aldrovandia affinis]
MVGMTVKEAFAHDKIPLWRWFFSALVSVASGGCDGGEVGAWTTLGNEPGLDKGDSTPRIQEGIHGAPMYSHRAASCGARTLAPPAWRPGTSCCIPVEQKQGFHANATAKGLDASPRWRGSPCLPSFTAHDSTHGDPKSAAYARVEQVNIPEAFLLSSPVTHA